MLDTRPRKDWSGALRSLGQVRRRKVEWLWEGFIANKECNIIEGQQGDGKSWLCMQIMVDLARQQKHSLYICNEDDEEYVTEPRIVSVLGLEAEYVNYIHLYHNTIKHRLTLGRGPSMAIDLRDIIRQTHSSLVIINPLYGFLPDKTNMNSAESMTPVFETCSMVAKEEGCGFIFVRHFSKAEDGKDAINKGLGSVAIGGSARVIVQVIRHPDYPTLTGDEFTKTCVAVQTKNNLGIYQTSKTFELTLNHFRWIPDAREVTPEEVAKKKEDMFNSSLPQDTRDAKGELIRMFSLKPRYEAVICLANVKAIGYSESSGRRAAQQLGVEKETEYHPDGSFKKHWWSMPEVKRRLLPGYVPVPS